MSIKKMALELCRREKGKKEVNVAQIGDLLNHLADIFFEASTVPTSKSWEWKNLPGAILFKHGLKRFEKRSKSKKGKR